MRFDISLQNFEKPLVDISPQITRKTIPKNISILFWLSKENFERLTCRKFIEENSKHWEAGGLKLNLIFKLKDSGFL